MCRIEVETRNIKEGMKSLGYYLGPTGYKPRTRKNKLKSTVSLGMFYEKEKLLGQGNMQEQSPLRPQLYVRINSGMSRNNLLVYFIDYRGERLCLWKDRFRLKSSTQTWDETETAVRSSVCSVHSSVSEGHSRQDATKGERPVVLKTKVFIGLISNCINFPFCANSCNSGANQWHPSP